MPYTERSRANLLREGIAGDRIYVIGNPIKQVIDANEAGIKASSALASLGVRAREYFLVTLHRAENVDIEPRLRSFVEALRQLHATLRIPGDLLVPSADALAGRGFWRGRQRRRASISAAVRVLRFHPPRAGRVLCPVRQRYRSGRGLPLRRPERHAARRDRAPRNTRMRLEFSERRSRRRHHQRRRVRHETSDALDSLRRSTSPITSPKPSAGSSPAIASRIPLN